MERTGMSKRAMLFLVVVGISAGYDFYRGYDQTRSVGGGIVYVILGLVVLALFWWLYSQRPSSN
jgi:uncharacterized transporter YbjL